MYEQLGRVTLKDGERVEAGVVIGPDEGWADRVETLLGHKGPTWRWGNEMVLRSQLPLEAYYYLLHRDGEPFANMMNIEVDGVGLYGHVYTKPEDRRKGAASLLLPLLMDHFRERGGRALVLGTGYDSPPYHIYAEGGFAGIEPHSGQMAYYKEGESAFYESYFAGQTLKVERLDWMHWPPSIPLFIGRFPGLVRSAVMGIMDRHSTEGPVTGRIQRELRRLERGAGPGTVALRGDDTGAIFGLATFDEHPIWPRSLLVDVYCHPVGWERASEMIEVLDLDSADRQIAYCDAGFEAKETILESLGFRPSAMFPERIVVGAAKTRYADVREWEKR